MVVLTREACLYRQPSVGRWTGRRDLAWKTGTTQQRSTLWPWPPDPLCRLECIEMAATMLLPRGVAVNPTVTEETIFHTDQTRVIQGLSRQDGRDILFTVVGVNVVGSSLLHLGQGRATPRIGSMDRLLPGTINDFEAPCGE